MMDNVTTKEEKKYVKEEKASKGFESKSKPKVKGKKEIDKNELVMVERVSNNEKINGQRRKYRREIADRLVSKKLAKIVK
jgi:hypothetical protein